MSQTFGRYILERTLAIGGMGEVFHARQTGPNGFDRTCVVKMMHAQHATDAEIVELFLEEARLTARLTHPHIAQVYDFGKIDASLYMAMELVDGPSLHTIIKSFAVRGRQLPLGPVLRIVSQAAQALDYVHRLKGPDGAPLNLVHRDISPGNLLLSKDGLVKLIDFGIAKARTTQLQTRMGQIRGKLAYMSPEQMLGMPLDGRTDIYSLGLVLYELLSGRRANPGRNEVEILSSVKTGTLTPLAALRDDCPKALTQVLEKATKRDREQRFQRAGELSQALEQLLVAERITVGPMELAAIAEEVELVPPHPSPAAPRRAPAGAQTVVEAAAATQPKQRLRSVLFVVAALVVTALGGSAGILWAAMGSSGGGAADVAVKPKAPEPPPQPPPPPQPARVEPAVVVTEPDAVPEPATAKAPAKAPRPVPKAPRTSKGEKPIAAKDEPHDPVPPQAPAPAATTGALHVSSEPPTEIFVDGRQAGVTPTSLELSAGPHRVELKEPRLGLSWVRSVEVAAGGRESLSWKPSHGLLDVRPVPPHVELQIAVDGVTVGPTPISAFSVWEGHRKVSAHNAATGWRTEKSIEVPPGGRVRIKVNDGSGIEVVAR